MSPTFMRRGQIIHPERVPKTPTWRAAGDAQKDFSQWPEGRRLKTETRFLKNGAASLLGMRHFRIWAYLGIPSLGSRLFQLPCFGKKKGAKTPRLPFLPGAAHAPALCLPDRDQPLKEAEASTRAFRSSSVCAKETMAVSKAEGARQMPLSRMWRKYRA